MKTKTIKLTSSTLPPFTLQVNGEVAEPLIREGKEGNFFALLHEDLQSNSSHFERFGFEGKSFLLSYIEAREGRGENYRKWVKILLPPLTFLPTIHLADWPVFVQGKIEEIIT